MERSAKTIVGLGLLASLTYMLYRESKKSEAKPAPSGGGGVTTGTEPGHVQHPLLTSPQPSPVVSQQPSPQPSPVVSQFHEQHPPSAWTATTEWVVMHTPPPPPDVCLDPAKLTRWAVKHHLFEYFPDTGAIYEAFCLSNPEYLAYLKSKGYL